MNHTPDHTESLLAQAEEIKDSAITPPLASDLWLQMPPVTFGFAEYDAKAFVSKHVYTEGGVIAGDRPDAEVEEQLAFAEGKRVLILTAQAGSKMMRVNSNPFAPEFREEIVMGMCAELGRSLCQRHSVPKGIIGLPPEKEGGTIIQP